MPFGRLLSAVFALLLIGASLPGRAAVIDFNSLSGTGLVSQGNSYVEDGFLLSEAGAFGFFSIHEGSERYTGTVSFFSNTIDGLITLTQQGGGSFDLISIDLDNFSPAQSVTVNFLGTLAGGGTVTESFTTDAVLPGLETFAFTGFDEVVSVQWLQQAPFHSFDNIVVSSQVPEPVTLALVGIGLAGLGFSRRKRVAA